MLTPLVAVLSLAPSSTPEGQWGPTTMTAVALARQVDARLATLSKATLNYRYSFDRPEGAGFQDNVATIVSPGVFEIQVPKIDERKGVPMVRETWVADGRRFGSIESSAFPKPRPMAQRSKGPAHPAAAWFLNFSQVIFAGLGQASHPFERLVGEAGAYGLRTSVEGRQLAFRGRRLVFYRLVLSKKGTRYETVFDGRQFLPVSVTNTVGPRDNARLSGPMWNLRPGKALDPSRARFRKQGAELPLVPAPRPR